MAADVAVLQLRGAGGLPSAAIDSGVAVGEPVVAMGNSGGRAGAPCGAWQGGRSAKPCERRIVTGAEET